MTAKSLRNALESVTNIAVLVVCVAVTFVLLRGTSQSAGSAPPSALRSGEEFLNASTFHIREGQETLVLALSARCTFCEASIPFYERLASADTVGAGVGIVVVFPESESEAKSFARRIGSNLKTVTGQNFRDLRIDGTPMS
jgi:hypothetical protein